MAKERGLSVKETRRLFNENKKNIREAKQKKKGDERQNLYKSPKETKKILKIQSQVIVKEGHLDAPIKEFGKNFMRYYRNGKGAIKKLLTEKQGQVTGAFYRNGIGDITLAWGEKGSGKSDGWGLAKIAEYHPEVLDKLDILVRTLPIVKETHNRVKLDDGKFFVSIRKDFEGIKENWILTAFERDTSTARRRTNLSSSQREAEKTTSANANANYSIKSKTTREIIDMAKERGLSVKETRRLVNENKEKLMQVFVDGLYSPHMRNIKQILRKYTKQALQTIKGKEIMHKNGVIARISSVGIDKMMSDKAIQKSLDNGFDIEQHFKAVRNIDKLFENAEFIRTEAPKNHSKDIVGVHRYLNTNDLQDINAQALITLKESVEHGNKIYSLELEELIHPYDYEP